MGLAASFVLMGRPQLLLLATLAVAALAGPAAVGDRASTPEQDLEGSVVCSTQCAARPAAPSTSPGVAELKQEHEDLTAECKSAESSAQQAAVAADSAAASRADCDAAKKCTDDEVAQLENRARTADIRKAEMEQAAARCRSRLGQLANDTKFITENAVANENLKNVVEEVKTADDFIARCEEADNPQVCPPSKLASLRKKKNDLLAAQMNAEMQKKALEKKYPALNAGRTAKKECYHVCLHPELKDAKMGSKDCLRMCFKVLRLLAHRLSPVA